MGEFKTNRMSDSTIGNTIDDNVGFLETDIVEALGLTLGVEFTGRQVAKCDSEGYASDSVKWSTSPGNGAAYGWRSTGEYGEAGILFGEVLYLKSDGRWYKAKADDAATSGPVELAMALAPGGAYEIKPILIKGFVCNTGWGWGTKGAPLYLSAASAGAMSQSAPTDADHVVRIVGYARAASIIIFDPDHSWVELAAAE